MTNREKIHLICPFCGYEWDYGGKRKITATCPDCLKMVKIIDARQEVLQRLEG